MRGQITDIPKDETLMSTTFKFTSPVEKTEYDKEFVLLVGCPAAGKDSCVGVKTYANNFRNYSVVSFDQIRLDLYKKEFGDSTDNKNVLYDKAWKYCNNKKYNLENIMFNDYISKIKHNVIISNTNLTIKARRRLINRINKEYNNVKITIIYIFVEEDELIKRDLLRKENDKSVGADVITRMFYSFDLPTTNEEVDKIFIFYNN
jgi:predicted kinase